MGRKKETFLVKTFRPGMKFVDIYRNIEYKEISGMNRAQIRAAYGSDNPAESRIYHTNDMWMDNQDSNNIKEDLIILTVPAEWEGQINDEGYIELEDESQVIHILNSLEACNDDRVGLDLRFGKDISAAGKKLLKGRPAIYGMRSELKTKAVSKT
jgi:hypothetical protein